MNHYAAIDVSLERSSICIVDASGTIVCEAKIASDPEALVDFFSRSGLAFVRVGLEAGPRDRSDRRDLESRGRRGAERALRGGYRAPDACSTLLVA